VYTPNLRIKIAVTPEKLMGYGFSPLEKILFYDKLTLGGCPRIVIFSQIEECEKNSPKSPFLNPPKTLADKKGKL